MRMMLGIMISIPVAIAFCLVYLLMVGLEAWRDAAVSRQGVRRVPVEREAWSGPAGTAE